MDLELSPRQQNEVEKILDRRIKDSRIEYFIKWGHSDRHPSNHSSWEPIQNLKGALKKVLRFEKSAKLSAITRRQRRAMITVGHRRATVRKEDAKTKIDQVKRSFFSVDDIQTIIIEDSDQEAEKHEDSVQAVVMKTRPIVEAKDKHESRMIEEHPDEAEDEEGQNKGGNGECELGNGSQKKEGEQVFMITYKDNRAVVFTKEQLMRKHPKQFQKYSTTKAQKKESD